MESRKTFEKSKICWRKAATEAGRPAERIRLLAVSKKKPLEAILEAAEAGQRDFGENFVQEGIAKIRAADRNDLVWHFIGHLQSNKTRDVAENFQWVHTVDRRKIARRLSDQRPAGAPDLNICIEVNVDAEASKSGVAPDEVAELAHAIADLPRLRLRGLMCLPAIRSDFEEAAQALPGTPRTQGYPQRRRLAVRHTIHGHVGGLCCGHSRGRDNRAHWHSVVRRPGLTYARKRTFQMISNKVGLIGGGNMARAIGGGLLRGGMHATDLMIAEPLPEQCDRLRKELYGAMVTEDNRIVARTAEILLFAVKPQILKPVCEDLVNEVQASRPLIMSIAAGPRIDDIDSWLGGGMSVVRVMPNQPALIDQGISALFANERTSQERKDQAEKIMTAVGHAVWLDAESKMDAVTAVSGTGPSYFYLLIDVMIESAKKYGIDDATARKLAVETARGATALAAAETESMASLIERVRSPGGTTTAAFEYLDSMDARGIFATAIDEAERRAAELAKEAGNA